MALKDLIVLFTLCHGKAIIPSKLSFYTSSKSIPPSLHPLNPNFQLPVCVSSWSFKHVHLLNNQHFNVNKNLRNLTWLHQWRFSGHLRYTVRTCHTSTDEVTPKAKVKLSNTWDHRGIRRKTWVIQICYLKKECKTKALHGKSVGSTPTIRQASNFLSKIFSGFSYVFIWCLPEFEFLLFFQASSTLRLQGKIWFLPSSFHS